jgi:hypothetical protein
MSVRRVAPWLAALVALALVVLGIVLVVTGGGDDAPAHPPSTSDTTTTAAPGGASVVTLPLGDTTQAGLSKLTGLALPAGTADFLSTHLDSNTQLDITFTIPKGAEASFVAASRLPTPKAGERVVDHSTPLWKLNPEGTISGTHDTHGSVARAVELVPEGGRVRVRVVITPAG